MKIWGMLTDEQIDEGYSIEVKGEVYFLYKCGEEIHRWAETITKPDVQDAIESFGGNYE